MAYLVAIEHDSKCYKDISESLSGLAKSLGHELLLFESAQEFKAEFNKPENAEKVILLILISLEETGKDPIGFINDLKTRYKADVLLSMFDDPLKPLKKPEMYPVQNIIYKPFDPTILQEHTRFALMPAQKIKTQFVHTTEVETEIEVLKKFRISDLSEFGFKVDKKYKLESHRAYKFYHDLFDNKKTQHIWARVVAETPEHYELLFCQTITNILSQIRKKVATSSQKVKNPSWRGDSLHSQNSLKIALQLSETDLAESIQDLLSRNFKNLSFIQNKELDPKQRSQVDVLITEIAYDAKTLDAQFSPRPVLIRLHDDKDILKRHDLEKQFEIETLRIERPLDKSSLVKNIKMLFPALEENDEKIQLLTILLDEVCSLSEVLKIQDFSEAAISFVDATKYELNQVVDIALPQEDESHLQEMKAKIHFVSEKPDAKKMFAQQFVLFGMRDEYLKLMRLWALQKHIEKNKKGT